MFAAPAVASAPATGRVGDRGAATAATAVAAAGPATPARARNGRFKRAMTIEHPESERLIQVTPGPGLLGGRAVKRQCKPTFERGSPADGTTNRWDPMTTVFRCRLGL